MFTTLGATKPVNTGRRARLPPTEPTDMPTQEAIEVAIAMSLSEQDQINEKPVALDDVPDVLYSDVFFLSALITYLKGC